MTARVKPSNDAVVPLGELRERVSIQRETITPDDAGGQAVSWATVYSNIPARVQPVRGQEPEIHGRQITFKTYLITVRYGFVITELDRVVWGSEVMNIRSVGNRDRARRRLTLECEAGVGT